MTRLNDLPGFSWAVYSASSPGLAKVCVDGESFWVREVKPSDGIGYTGRVDNDLCMTEVHGLKLDDQIAFTPYIPEES